MNIKAVCAGITVSLFSISTAQAEDNTNNPFTFHDIIMFVVKFYFSAAIILIVIKTIQHFFIHPNTKKEKKKKILKYLQTEKIEVSKEERQKKDAQIKEFLSQKSSDLPPPIISTREKDKSLMDGTRIEIFYRDLVGDHTSRDIILELLEYKQEGTVITPTYVHAHCELRDERRTFLPKRIMLARFEGELIDDINDFLIVHTDIPRYSSYEDYEEAQERKREEEKERLLNERARLKKVLLDDPRIMVFCGFSNPNRKPAEHTMRLSSMITATKKAWEDGGPKDVTTIRSISGFDVKARKHKKVTFSRIVNACDPDTGEVYENLEEFLFSKVFKEN